MSGVDTLASYPFATGGHFVASLTAVDAEGNRSLPLQRQLTVGPDQYEDDDAPARASHFPLTDLPGYPASHGCIGLYDEPMQKEQYGIPNEPELNDAKRLFEWVLGGEVEDDRVITLPHGPRVHILGKAPSRH